MVQGQNEELPILSVIIYFIFFNHTSDNKIRWPQSVSPICSSQVWLQTELDNTKSHYQLNIKIIISKKRRIDKLWKKVKIWDWLHSNGYAGC